MNGLPQDALAGVRVLHVVQKFSSGVGTAIVQYTRSLPEVEHHLLSGTAVDGEGDLGDRAVLASVHRMSGGTVERVRRVRAVTAALRPDVVHAHSSHGGAYARMALRRDVVPVVYTPHCYSFERRDVTALSRGLFRAAEALLAVNTTVFAACSDRERELSAWPTRHAPRFVVPNVGPTRDPAPLRSRRAVPVVVGGGRLSPQKDPEFFLACIRSLRNAHPDLRAVWVGGGDREAAGRLQRSGVEVSDWLPSDAALDLLSSADLYLHSAAWEGFPVMVTEAVAAGVPTVVRRIPCFAGLPTDLTIARPDDLSAVERCLRDDDAASANVERWRLVLSGNTAERQRDALRSVYLEATV